MLENCEEFISLTLRTRNSKKPLRMLEENWKHSKKFACSLEASESTRLRMEEFLPNHHEEHIAGKGDNSLRHYNLVHKIIPMPQAMCKHFTSNTAKHT